MTCVPAIMPTAKTPTAIDSTTSPVRTLLLDRSRNTLRQRGLTMHHHLLPNLACGSVLRQTLSDHSSDRFFGRRRFSHQPLALAAVKRNDLDAGIMAGPHRGGVGGAGRPRR